MMEDKTFELLTQMYSDLTIRLDSIECKLDQKADKNNLFLENENGNRLLHIENDLLNIENIHGKKLEALFDGLDQITQGQNEIKDIVNEILVKVDCHDIKIQVIQDGKKVINC